MLMHHPYPGSFLLLPPYTGFQPPANNTKNHCILFQLFLGKYLNFRSTQLLLTLTLQYLVETTKTGTPVPQSGLWVLQEAEMEVIPNPRSKHTNFTVLLEN